MNPSLSTNALRPDTADRPRPRRGRLTRSQREAIIAWLFILPDALGLAVFVGFPMLFSLGLGFFSVSGFGTYKFIGLANYARMFKDPLFLKSLWVTITYVVILVPGLCHRFRPGVAGEAKNSVCRPVPQHVLRP